MRFLILAFALCVSCPAFGQLEADIVRKKVGLLPPAQLRHKLDAFDGLLLGFNGGEWGGGLAFRDKQGNTALLNRENVTGIVKVKGRVYVFSGLAHMGFNEGKIVELTDIGANLPSEHLLVVLEGEASAVHLVGDDTVSFRVFEGFRRGKAVYRCKSFADGVVSRGKACEEE